MLPVGLIGVTEVAHSRAEGVDGALCVLAAFALLLGFLLGYDIDGSEPPWPSNERWKHVQGDYQERFGPEASTIGPPEEWQQVYGDD